LAIAETTKKEIDIEMMDQIRKMRIFFSQSPRASAQKEVLTIGLRCQVQERYLADFDLCFPGEKIVAKLLTAGSYLPI
jgi:hypothetical protein